MYLRKLVAVGSIGVMIASTSTIASADKYFSLFGAYTKVDDFDFQVAPGTVNTEFDDGYGLGIAFGKRLGQNGTKNRWRVEGELSYRSNDVDTHKLNGGALAGSTGKLKNTALMANVFIDFNEPAKFTPYLGAGLGLANVKADGFGVGAIPNVLDDDETVLAYQLIAGAGWDVSQKTELFAEYRYFATDDPSVTTSGVTGSVGTDIAYKSNNILLGARFRF